MANRTLLVFAGTTCLFLGIFLPFATVPIVGSVTLLGHSLTYSLLLIFAIFGAWLFSYLNAVRLLRDLGALLLVVFVGAVIYFEYEMHERITDLSQSLKGNPFSGLATAALGTTHLDVGIAVLILSAVLLIVSSFIRGPSSTASEADEGHGVGLFLGRAFRENKGLSAGIVAVAVVALGAAMYGDHQSELARQVAEAKPNAADSSALSNTENSTDTNTPPPSETRLNSIVTVQPLEKDFHASDPTSGDFQDSIVLTFQYHNLSRETLAAFKGLLELTNKFGDDIQGFKVDYEKPLAPGAVVTETLYYDYNQFDSADGIVRATPLRDMRFRWTPSKVLYANGKSMSNE